MSPWLALCRGAVADIRSRLAELPTREERERPVGIGKGGDETVAIDLAAENAVVQRLEELHETGLDFVLVSEELGERSFVGGDPGRGRVAGMESPEWRVVVDPIDGSVNAKRGIPFFSLSVAVATGPAMSDVVFGFVHDFGSGEEWTAERGKGAKLDSRPLDGPGPKPEIEVLAFEATLTDYVAKKSGDFLDIAPRLRIMGSLALSLCHLAAGRIDGVVSLKPIRSVDIAAGQLLLLERGLAIELPDGGAFEEAPLDVESRSRVVAARTPEHCARLVRALLV
jgi:myo-inositol-1(or 4)-monophosphatase